MAANVRVGVRVRPFNARERSRGASLVVAMDGATTTLTHPETHVAKSFTFDARCVRPGTRLAAPRSECLRGGLRAQTVEGAARIPRCGHTQDGGA